MSSMDLKSQRDSKNAYDLGRLLKVSPENHPLVSQGLHLFTESLNLKIHMKTYVNMKCF